MSAKPVTITVTLEPAQAAALHRLCDKIGHDDAMRYTYPHVQHALRSDQAYEILGACGTVQRALEDEGVRNWPWIETGRVQP